MKIMIFRAFCNFSAFTAFQKKWGKCNFRQNPNLFQCISSLFWWVYLKNGSLFISGLRDISHHTLMLLTQYMLLVFQTFCSICNACKLQTHHLVATFLCCISDILLRKRHLVAYATSAYCICNKMLRMRH